VDKSSQVGGNLAGSDCAEPLDPLLARALRTKYDVARIFAWGGSITDGSITWVDRAGYLRRARVTKDEAGYTLSLSPYEPADKAFMAQLDAQAMVPIAEFLEDTEVAVRADVIEFARCQAAVILVWRAKLRCFQDPDDRFQEMWPGLRVVVRRAGTIISNSAVDFPSVYPQEVLVDDVNGDGAKDYAFLGGIENTILYVWTLTNLCRFQQLEFLAEGSNESEDFIEDRSVSLKRDEKGGKYSILVQGPCLKEAYCHQVYRWSPTKGAFFTSDPYK
jgi:hypothetical protein